ncbi:MAG: OB-fold nucleic acid binding domain-containing protein, partial [Candidatus Nanohaloarchaeota archaeon QJJ-5]|nr:OB-fold nucleic acid binding domain-containing protein [Candidatus Nanohaloarchaeota archaeon QJJ-5]
EGAAHLVAREYGVAIEQQGEKELKVDNVVPGMNKVNMKAKVIDITDTHTFERDDGDDGKVRNLVLGDETGTVRLSLWDDQTEVAEKIDVDDTIAVENAYSKEDNRGNPEIRIGDSSTIKRIDEEIENVATRSSSSGGNTSYEDVTVDQVIDEGSNYEVTGEILQIYTDNPFYQVCPECDTTLKQDDDYECPEHGDVDPTYRLALPAILDDGFGNIRCVFFQDRAKELLEMDEDHQGNSRKVQEHAEKAVGKRVIIRGRSQTNDFFDSMELLVNDIETPSIDTIIDHKIEALTNE